MSREKHRHCANLSLAWAKARSQATGRPRTASPRTRYSMNYSRSNARMFLGLSSPVWRMVIVRVF